MMEQLVPIEDVAKHFGVSLSTTRKWVQDGVIPENTYIKIGHTQRFALASIAEALLKGSADEGAPAEEGFNPTDFDPDEDV
jgi:hypothetical protein